MPTDDSPSPVAHYDIVSPNKSALHHRHHFMEDSELCRNNGNQDESPSTANALHADDDKERDGIVRQGLTSENDDALETDKRNNTWQTVASVAGNVLEWYDFAVFGALSDVLGQVFFPPSENSDTNIMESFAVFGGAFLMRPIGGVLMGSIGDRYGRKKALTLSIFLMAFPTFAMGCLPGYSAVGSLSIILLLIVRLLQGLSVGGQLMSSLVYTLESHDPIRWGLYGSYVMCAANVGTLLGNLVGTFLRSIFNEQQLLSYGWRIPFLSGIIVSFSGFYLRAHGQEIHAEDVAHHHHVATNGHEIPTTQTSPIRLAFARHNLPSLLAASTVPMLWSSGFYLSFVWMSIYTTDLLVEPLEHGFAVNCLSLLVSVCIFFPYAGMLSDVYGRKRVMTIGGVTVGTLSPFLLWIIGQGDPFVAFVAQSIMGVALSCWGGPMMAWLVEGFEPEARLTSVAIGYNIAQATVGGFSPTLATFLAKDYGPNAPGLIFPVVAFISVLGLRVVAPPSIHYSRTNEDEAIEEPETELVESKFDREML